MANATNRRVELNKPGEPLELVTQAVPHPPAKGAVVKVWYSGVCHSDVHTASRLVDPRSPPRLVLGHEVSGVIHSLGHQVKTDGWLAPGRRVAVFPWLSCDGCLFCQKEPLMGLCVRNTQGPKPPTWLSCGSDGGFQEYLSIPDVNVLLPIPSSMSMATAAISCCSGLTAFNAVETINESVRAAINRTGNALVLTVGVGGLAYWAIQILKFQFGDKVRICAVDVVREKMEYARLAGADLAHVWEAGGTTKAASISLLKAMGGSRPDAAIDFVGIPSTLERILTTLNLCSTLAVVGIGDVAGKELPPYPGPLVAVKRLRIQGVVVGSINQLREVHQLIVDNKIRPPPMTFHKLEEVNSIVAAMSRGQVLGRAVLRMTAAVVDSPAKY